MDDAYVYWATGDGSVVRCAKGGCDQKPTVLVSGQVGLGPIAVDAASVYWYRSGEIMTCPLAGCAGTPTKLVSGYVNSLALSAAAVYWTTYNTFGSVFSCAKDGCQGTPVTIASGQNGAFDLVADSVNVYWTNNYVGGGISSCALSGCNDTPRMLSVDDGAMPITMDANRVYWGDYNGDVDAVDIGDSSTTTIAQNLSEEVCAIALDETNVYFATNVGEIKRCVKSGCGDKPTLMVAASRVGPSGPEVSPVWAMAVDNQAIYWATSDGPYDVDAALLEGKVMKVCK